jgi:hypothetical protein
MGRLQRVSPSAVYGRLLLDGLTFLLAFAAGALALGRIVTWQTA